jgi:hypothetical protein
MLLGMGKVQLDEGTADRMLAGIVDPADVPPGFEGLAELLAAVRSAAHHPVRVGVHTPAIVDSRRVPGQTRGRRSMFATTPFKPRLSVLAAAMALSATTGAAFAAGLPAAAVGKADTVLHQIGIGTPAPPAHVPAAPRGAHGGTVSHAATTTTATGAARGARIAGIASAGKSHAGRHGQGAGTHPKGGTESGHHGKGAEISALAHSTTGKAGAKGATISAAASGGKSHAGAHGHGASADHGGKSAGHGDGGGRAHG